MRRRYAGAEGRKEKSKILDEICATTGYDRKYVIRAMRRRSSATTPGRSRRGRKRTYGREVLAPLKKIWLAANLPCGKRLEPMMPLWLPGYEALHGELDAEVRRKLLSMSPSTIDRLLAQPRQKLNLKGRCTTKPGGLLRHHIPIQTGQWRETRPGYIEADTVAHCGESSLGPFVLTLDCVDIATGWTEQRAIWTKLASGVVRQMVSIEKALPFRLKGFDSDNGSEFINEILLKHFLKRHRPVLFTRSRAYKKNDNAHVEQKNWTHVRQWIGYGRLDKPEATDLLNDLYTNEWRLFHNFYSPSMKLISKQRVGAKVVKKYDSPKTPYQRVMQSDDVNDYHKRGLAMIFENTNPFILRRAIEKKLKRIHRLMNHGAR